MSNFSEEKDGSTECLNVKHYQEKKNFTSKTEKALIKAKNYKSENPLFIVVMTSSYTNQYMVSLSIYTYLMLR